MKSIKLAILGVSAFFSISGSAAECVLNINNSSIPVYGSTKNNARTNASNLCLDIKLDEFRSEHGGREPSDNEAEDILFSHCLNICSGS